MIDDSHEYTIDQFEKVLDYLVDALENDPAAIAFERCKSVLGSGMDAIFSSTTDSAGGTWPAHAESTIRSRGEHPLLIDTGALRRSMLGAGEGHVEEVQNRTLTWGTSIEYGIYNNFGTRTIPPREFAYVSEAIAAGCLAEFVHYVNTVIIG